MFMSFDDVESNDNFTNEDNQEKILLSFGKRLVLHGVTAAED